MKKDDQNGRDNGQYPILRLSCAIYILDKFVEEILKQMMKSNDKTVLQT